MSFASIFDEIGRILLIIGGTGCMIFYFFKRMGKRSKSPLIYDLWGGFNHSRLYHKIAFYLVFLISRLIMSMLVAMGSILPAEFIASVFFVVAVSSFCFMLGCCGKVFDSMIIHIVNVILEFSIVFLATVTLLSESIGFGESALEGLGFATIIVLMLV